MVSDGLAHLAHGVVFPRRRRILLAGIGPRVGVVEVYHHRHTQCFGPLCLGYDIGLVAPSIGRVDPHTQTDGIDTHTLQDRKAVAGLAVGTVELPSGRLHLGEPTHIGTLGKRNGHRRLFFVTTGRGIASASS